MKQVKFITGLMAFGVVSLFAGCGEKENEMTKVTLNEVAHSIFYAPQYVAMENGYFTQEGLDLELVTGYGADKTMAAVISGEAQIGLPSPGFAKIPTSGLAPELIAHLHFPLVTKPLDKYGSRGIYVVHNLEELKQAITETASFTDLPEILVEEYNDGYEFNMMTWVHKGKVHVISIADREKTDIGPGEIPISTRNVYPSCLYEQVVAPATDLLQCYADKTGQKEGALSMQFFWKPENGIQVCEIAARFFGYEHELTDMVYGFSIEDLLLNYLYDVPALEQMLDQHDPRNPICHGAVLYFQGRLLQIRDLSVPQKLASHSAVEKPWIFYHEGESVIAHGPNPYVALYYISCPSRKKLDQVTDEFFTSMTIPSLDGKEVLYRNQMPDYPKTK